MEACEAEGPCRWNPRRGWHAVSPGREPGDTRSSITPLNRALSAVPTAFSLQPAAISLDFDGLKHTIGGDASKVVSVRGLSRVMGDFSGK
jgi:hypothetical protein